MKARLGGEDWPRWRWLVQGHECEDWGMAADLGIPWILLA